MTIQIEYETDRDLGIDQPDELIRQVVVAALDYENCPYEAEVSVLLTDQSGIQEINRENRGIDAPTDVLSFPLIEYETPADFSVVEDPYFDAYNPDTEELMLGDIVISVDRIWSQAEEFGHSRKRELAFLVAHSMLHLMGYDHMEDKERIVMEQRQEAILQNLNITRS